MKRFQKAALCAAAVLLLDQLTKFWAIQGLVFGRSAPLIPGVFHLTLTYNKGVAFGMLAKAGDRAAIAALAALIVLAISFLRSDGRSGGRSESQLTVWAMGLILGGAVGNLIDRWRVGAVVDFLDFRVWPVFNVADSAITAGACL
ncbi:MAG: signal peptidase II, partial [Candidatus Omnitrophica bacterium]|nr:signal peptidase II [Candidatus Omnitrophota bacterium]